MRKEPNQREGTEHHHITSQAKMFGLLLRLNLINKEYFRRNRNIILSTVPQYKENLFGILIQKQSKEHNTGHYL